MTTAAPQARKDSPPAPPSLLLVDDDPLILDSLGGFFEDEFAVVCAANRQEAAAALLQMSAAPDFAAVDLGLPPAPHRPDEGLAVIREIQAGAPKCAIVAVSGQDQIQNAMRARALGAIDFVAKPCAPAALRAALLRAREVARAAAAELGLVGESPPMQKLRAQIRQIAPSPFSVLIEGETGAGKEVVARALHNVSRPGAPFVAVHCAAIPPHLVEPTLFGSARGAFTGALPAPGYFGDAAGGTLFLDEIGDLSESIQAKLLRALESGEYRRVGESRVREASARIVAASNRPLAAAVRRGEFRGDLYHRIGVFTLRAPSLREIGDDRFLLFDHYRKRVASELCADARRFGGRRARSVARLSLRGQCAGAQKYRRPTHRQAPRRNGLGCETLIEEIDPANAGLDAAAAADGAPPWRAFIESQIDNDDFDLAAAWRRLESIFARAAARREGGDVARAARLLGLDEARLRAATERDE